jgi:transcriptional regulator with XRE-family HTH domain
MTLGAELRAGRRARRLSLQSAADSANVSTAYLHKLEADRVRSPSPHVLLRLAQALGIPYAVLMDEAGYLLPDAEEGRMTTTRNVKTPTNARILEALERLSDDLGDVRRRQDDLARKVERLLAGSESATRRSRAPS